MIKEICNFIICIHTHRYTHTEIFFMNIISKYHYNFFTLENIIIYYFYNNCCHTIITNTSHRDHMNKIIDCLKLMMKNTSFFI